MSKTAGVLIAGFMLCLAAAAQVAQSPGVTGGVSAGGGSGTVSSCGGAGNSYYSGAGTTVVCDTNIADSGTGNLTFSAAAPQLITGTNINLTLALGGTGTVIFNNGTATNPAFNHTQNASNTGWFSSSASIECWANVGGIGSCFSNSGNQVSGNRMLAFTSTTAANGAIDLGLSPIATSAAVLAVGNGTVADESALLRSGNACRVTADITLTVNTNVTVCTWTLPAVAKAWAWQCEIPWTLSAGSGTNTLAVIANASQTPTGATNGTAEVKTSNTNAAQEGTAAISASGATTLVTATPLTPVATVFQSSTSGTLLASATAGTFAIQMNAAGTTATALAKAGATCLLY